MYGYDYYDSFDCEVQCEEFYGEEFNLWEEEQCYLDREGEEFEDWHDDCDQWECEEDSFLDGYWESLTEVTEW